MLGSGQNQSMNFFPADAGISRQRMQESQTYNSSQYEIGKQSTSSLAPKKYKKSKRG